MKCKKLILLFGVLLLVACKATKPVKLAERTLKGNWTLTSISYSRPGSFNVNLYNDSGANCFINSNWKFIPNNNTATYQFSNSECETTIRKVKWTIPIPSGDSYNFLMKPLNFTQKAKEITRGFKTQLKSLTSTNMVWTQKLNFENKPFIITMNFIKSI